MDTDIKDVVQKNFMMCTEYLRLKCIPVIRYLFDEEAINKESAEKCMGQIAHTMKTVHLLDHLMPLPSRDFDLLYASTLSTKAWKAADVLEPEHKPHSNKDGQIQIPLPEEWPTKELIEAIDKGTFEVKTVIPLDEKMNRYYVNSRKYNVYEMKKELKGRALIINNTVFDHLAERKGSEHDRNGLRMILTKLGYQVEIHDNQTCAQMNELLQKEFKRDHTDFNCFFLFILSHGSSGIVYGTDGVGKENGLKIETIKASLLDVKSLGKKPKVIIIQACRGDKTTMEIQPVAEVEDKPIIEEPHDGPSSEQGGVSMVVERNAQAQDNQMAHEEHRWAGDPIEAEYQDFEVEDKFRGNRLDEDNSIEAKEPYHFYTALPTVEGYVSYRSTNYGSWFIQALIFCLANYSHKEDLDTLFLKVNKLVRMAKKDPGDININKRKINRQVSWVNSTFIKKFYFFPGMPIETQQKKKQSHGGEPDPVDMQA